MSGALGVGAVQQAAQADRAVLHQQAALDVVDHLGDGDGFLIDVEDGALAQAGEDLLEDADEVDGVGGDLLFHTSDGSFAGGLLAEEVAHAGIGPGGFFDLLFLQQHLRGGLEALVLEQALDQFAAGVFGVGAGDVGRIARQQRLRLDVDEQRGHVDELAGGVDVGLLELVAVVEKLRGEQRDGDVVDVDILLADEVEQEIERAVVDLADGDGEGRLRGFLLGRFLGGGVGLGALGFGWRGDGAGLEGEGLGRGG